MRPVTLVCCTRGPAADCRLMRSIQKLAIPRERVVFFEHNTSPLSVQYNSVLEQRTGRNEIVLFVHDDALIADAFWEEKLESAIQALGFDVVGLAGTASFRIASEQPITMWLQRRPFGDPCANSGAVEHILANGETFWSSYGPTPRKCVVLDGVFLAVNMMRIGAIRFDEQFAFHFYDLDFCLSARRAGLVLGTTNIYVQHSSPGAYGSQVFKDAQERFRTKWSRIISAEATSA